MFHWYSSWDMHSFYRIHALSWAYLKVSILGSCRLSMVGMVTKHYISALCDPFFLFKTYSVDINVFIKNTVNYSLLFQFWLHLCFKLFLFYFRLNKWKGRSSVWCSKVIIIIVAILVIFRGGVGFGRWMGVLHWLALHHSIMTQEPWINAVAVISSQTLAGFLSSHMVGRFLGSLGVVVCFHQALLGCPPLYWLPLYKWSLFWVRHKVCKQIIFVLVEFFPG